MKINQISHMYKPATISRVHRKPEMSCDTVSFNGHLGQENVVENGQKLVLKHQTSLFRDMQTKNFVTDYIYKNFADKPNIKMVVGGCSSGEEVYTYAMLLNSIEPKLSILGFDLSKKSIQQAKSGELSMQKVLNDGQEDLFTDEFLCFDSKKQLTQKKLEQKELFDEFFEITPNVYKEKKSFVNKLLSKILKVEVPIYETKIIKVKDGKFKNCSFKEGNILKLADVTGGEKADVITFSNAMYHLITDEVSNGMFRSPKENAEEIVREIAKNVKENLNPNGIFVLGEEEELQTMDHIIVPKVFKELGFEPLNETNAHMENVWRLVSE